MGVDATLFARRARRAVYLDRLYYWRPDDADAQDLYEKLRGTCRGDGKATADDLIKLCGILMAEEAAATAAGEDPERNQKAWLWEVCVRFAQEHPDDEFFIQSDHDDPTWWEHGEALIVEDLAPVMTCVTYTLPSEPRTWRGTLRWINWHWFEVFTRGPRSFWWNARNRVLPLKLNRDLSSFDRQHEPYG